MAPETKLVIRRWAIRKLRLWFDAFHEWADARIHAAEVRLRDELSAHNSPAASFHGLPVRAKALPGTSCAAGEDYDCDPIVDRRMDSADVELVRERQRETWSQWEARRSGVAPVSKKSSRRRGMPARAFDLRFSNSFR